MKQTYHQKRRRRGPRHGQTDVTCARCWHIKSPGQTGWCIRCTTEATRAYRMRDRASHLRLTHAGHPLWESIADNLEERATRLLDDPPAYSLRISPAERHRRLLEQAALDMRLNTAPCPLCSRERPLTRFYGASTTLHDLQDPTAGLWCCRDCQARLISHGH